MTTPTLAMPSVARFGFDDGWLVLGPHFLNFGVPSLLVDYRLAGGAGNSLESFGNHHPEDPWCSAALEVRCANGHVGIWTKEGKVLVASRWLGRDLELLDGHDRLLVLAGDTHAVQLSWSALWTCRIGLCNLVADARSEP